MPIGNDPYPTPRHPRPGDGRGSRGLVELHLGAISAYLALLDAVAETVAGDPTASLIVCAADAHRALADLLWTTGRMDEAAAQARRALALDEAKGNRAAATATRRRFSRILGASPPHPGVQTQEGVKSSSYTDD